MPRIFALSTVYLCIYMLMINISFRISMSMLDHVGHGVPVVYIAFGNIPDFLYVNIEFASKNNYVIVLSDLNSYILAHQEDPFVTVYNLSDYYSSASKFSEVYKPHLLFTWKDKESVIKARSKYEADCFYRWYILHDFMKAHNLDVVFYGDGDTTIFVNVTNSFTYRSSCSAMINLESQKAKFHWVGGGEESYWTVPGLYDFISFTETIYRERDDIFTEKKKYHNVVDMSLLWIWWVAHFDSPGFHSGRPWMDYICRVWFDTNFNKTKQFNLPAVNKSIKLCNGMDAVQEGSIMTVFDHMHGWKEDGYSFDSVLVMPYMVGVAMDRGGLPITLNETVIKELYVNKNKVYFNSLHYQGNEKVRLIVEVCSYLGNYYVKQNRTVYSTKVKWICDYYAGFKW